MFKNTFPMILLFVVVFLFQKACVGPSPVAVSSSDTGDPTDTPTVDSSSESVQEESIPPPPRDETDGPSPIEMEADATWQDFFELMKINPTEAVTAKLYQGDNELQSIEYVPSMIDQLIFDGTIKQGEDYQIMISNDSMTRLAILKSQQELGNWGLFPVLQDGDKFLLPSAVIDQNSMILDFVEGNDIQLQPMNDINYNEMLNIQIDEIQRDLNR